MNWSNTVYSFLMLACPGAVLALLASFATRLSKDSKPESEAIRLALEKNCELLKAGKITTPEFEPIMRGLEHSGWVRGACHVKLEGVVTRV